MFRVLLLTVLSLTVPGAASACICFRHDSAQEHIDKADVIFEGIAEHTREAP